MRKPSTENWKFHSNLTYFTEKLKLVHIEKFSMHALVTANSFFIITATQDLKKNIKIKSKYRHERKYLSLVTSGNKLSKIPLELYT